MTKDEQDYQAYQEYQQYQQYQQASAPAQQEEPSYEDRYNQMGQVGKTWEAVKGIADTGATLASGAIAEPIAGMAGLAATAATQDSGIGTHVIEFTRNLLTHHAWSDAGKHNEEMLGKVAEKVAPALQKVDDGIGWVTGGDPLLSAALKTALYGIPAVMGTPGTKGLLNLGEDAALAARGIKKASHDTRVIGEKLGIKYTNDAVGRTTKEAIDKYTGGPAVRGEGLADVQDTVQQAERAAHDVADQLFDDARARRAFVSTSALKDVGAVAEAKLIGRGFDLAGEDMAPVRARLDELNRIDKIVPGTKEELQIKMGQRADPTKVAGSPVITSLRLKQLDVFERRLSAELNGVNPKAYTPRQAAISTIRNELRDSLAEQLDQGLIKGDQTAIAAFKDAKDAWTSYRKMFSEDRMIAKMVANDATNEEMFKWIMGASANGLKKEAVHTVDRLKAILGPNNPGMQTMKMAVLRDLFSPLYKGEIKNAHLNQVVRGIDKALEQNTSVINSLGIDPKELRAIRDSIVLSQKAGGAFTFDGSAITLFIAREAVGSGIAKAGAKVRIVHRILNAAIRQGKLNNSAINKILAEQPYAAPLVASGMPGYKETMREIAMAGAKADLMQQDNRGN